MIAVLLGSVNQGRSAWASVRGRKQVCVTGMQTGDLIKIFYKHSENVTWQEVEEDCSLPIPGTCKWIQADHIETSGSRVFVDLR